MAVPEVTAVLRNLQAIFSNSDRAGPYYGDVHKTNGEFADPMDPHPKTPRSMQQRGLCVPSHCASIGVPTARGRFRGGNLVLID
jgi:hypothetical protein